MNKLSIILGMMIIVSPISNAKELNLDLDFTNEFPLTALTDNDWDLLKTTARKLFNNEQDGASSFWKNEQSGNSGAITLLSTSSLEDRLCRDGRFSNTVGSQTSVTTVKLCKLGQGKWEEQGARRTTTYSSLEGSQKDMSTPSLTEPYRKTLGQSSEFCKNLSREIDELKGKPLRRSASRDLFQAECAR